MSGLQILKNQNFDSFYKVISMAHPPCSLIRESGIRLEYNKKYFREKYWLMSQNIVPTYRNEELTYFQDSKGSIPKHFVFRLKLKLIGLCLIDSIVKLFPVKNFRSSQWQTLLRRIIWIYALWIISVILLRHK